MNCKQFHVTYFMLTVVTCAQIVDNRYLIILCFVKLKDYKRLVCSKIRILHRSMGENPAWGTDLNLPGSKGHFQHSGKEKQANAPGEYESPVRYFSATSINASNPEVLFITGCILARNIAHRETETGFMAATRLDFNKGTSTRTCNVAVATQRHTHSADLTENSGHQL
jgi:hypothetical protein